VWGFGRQEHPAPGENLMNDFQRLAFIGYHPSIKRPISPGYIDAVVKAGGDTLLGLVLSELADVENAEEALSRIDRAITDLSNVRRKLVIGYTPADIATPTNPAIE
jgi:hypothetical protein